MTDVSQRTSTRLCCGLRCLAGVAVALLLLPLADVAQARNVLANPSFDPDLSGWETRIEGGCDATAKLVMGEAVHGLRFVRIVCRSARQPGRFLLLMTNPKLKAGTRYTLSACVRASQCGYAWIGGGPDWGLRHRLPQDTGGKWVRVSTSFAAKGDGTWPVMILIEDATERLDVDAVQLEAGDVATKFEGPSADVRLVPARFASLFFPGDEVRFTLEVENYATQRRSFEYDWRCRALVGDAGGMGRRSFPTGYHQGHCQVPPQDATSVPITPEGADQLGVYALEVMVRDESGQEFRPDGRFGRIQPPPETGYDRLGINIHVGTDAAAQLVRLLGLGWVRIDWNWSIFEQAGPGKIDFASMESWLTPVEKAGLKALPSLPYAPDWAKTNDGLFNREAHAAYVGRVAARFKGRVHSMDIWNEPESMMATPAQQDFWVEAAKGAYQAIKSVDPAITVVGPSVSVNPGGDCWTDALMKPPRSMGRYFDAWDFHTYPAPRNRRPERSERVSSVDGLSQTLPEIRKLVKGGQVWVTEYGFSTCDPNDPRTRESARNMPVLAPWHVTEEQQGNYLVRQTLLQLAYGIERAFIYQLGPDGEGGFVEEQWGLCRTRGGVTSPKVSFVQIAALARFLSKAKLVGVQIPEPNVRVVNVKTPSGPAMIAWAVEGEADLTVSFGPQGQLADRFGNPQRWEGGKSVRLTEAPVYLTGLR